MRVGCCLLVTFALFGIALSANAIDHHPSLSTLPLLAQARVSGVVARDVSAYQAKMSRTGIAVSSPEQRLNAEFTSRSLQLSNAAGDSWALALTAFGRTGNLQPLPQAFPKAIQNRVEYQRGELTEWYVNGPAGLEQGFTVSDRPKGAADEQLLLALNVSGNAILQAESELLLRDKNGSPEVKYAGLSAYDADRKVLPAVMEFNNHTLLIKVNDGGAHYPIQIDPVFQKAKMTSSDGQSQNNFGWSVAMSGDTIVVGAPYATIDQQSQGEAYIFVKPGSGWSDMTQTATLHASDASVEDNFGKSVAINGNTIVVGAPEHSVGAATDQGVAYVFVKPAGGWTDAVENAELSANDFQQHKAFGFSCAISGTTIVIGAPTGNVGSNKLGEAYVFVQPQGGWKKMTQTAILTTADGATGDSFGNSVGISGSTVAVGAPNAKVGSNAQQGAAYIFIKPASGWTDTSTANAKLTASDGGAHDSFGTSASFSGTTVVLGAPAAKVGNNASQGAAYIFVQPKNGWVTGTQTAKLTSSDGAMGDLFADSVSIAGSLIVVGAPGADIGSNTSQGAAYVYVKPAGGWKNTSTFTAKLQAQDGRSPDILGASVAVSGTTGAAGAPFAQIGANPGQGAVYVFSK